MVSGGREKTIVDETHKPFLVARSKRSCCTLAIIFRGRQQLINAATNTQWNAAARSNLTPSLCKMKSSLKKSLRWFTSDNNRKRDFFTVLESVPWQFEVQLQQIRVQKIEVIFLFEKSFLFVSFWPVFFTYSMLWKVLTESQLAYTVVFPSGVRQY